jgi:N12 class adenine-specific DNA methylase
MLPARTPAAAPEDEGIDPRTPWVKVKDLAASGLSGLVNVAKLPAMVGDRYVSGQWVGPGVEALSEFDDAVQEQKSPFLRRLQDESNQRSIQAGERAKEWVGGDGIGANTAKVLAELGVSAWEAVRDPKLLLPEIAQQAPMLGASALGGRATGALVDGAAKVAPRVAATAAGRAVAAGAPVAGAVATGAGLQAADIGSETQGRLNALPDEVWSQYQPFRELAAKVGPEEAKRLIVGDKASAAALQSAIASVLSSMLPGGASLERVLVGKGGWTSRAGAAAAAKAIGRSTFGEARQEGIEELYGQLAGNYAVRDVDPSQPLTENLGLAAGKGAALGGVMGGGATALNIGTTAAREAAGKVATSLRRPDQVDPAAAATAPPGAPPADPRLAAAVPDVESAETDAAAKALRRPPVEATALDRVQAIDAELAAAPEGADTAPLQAERAALTSTWPTVTPGAPTRFSTETGAQLEGQYALIEADDLQPSHDTNLRPNPAYPQSLQPRQRDRAASATQIQSIVGRLDPARLGESATAGDGAPIIGADGLVESGNARTIALRRVYAANGLKAQQYRQWLAENAQRFGLAPEQVEGLRRPVLVRVRSTPVNRAEFAWQANASTVAAMSPREQSLADAARIDSLEDLRPTEDGEFATSRDFIRRFVGSLPETERGAMIDADGRLSSAGYARARNAVLAKAYGDSPVLTRLVESMDDTGRNIAKALVIAAPRMAQARSMIDAGRRHSADLTPALVEAASELERLRQAGQSVDEALQQQSIDGQGRSAEAGKLMRFMADNARRPRRIAELLTAYTDALDAAGDPAQGDLLGGSAAPTVDQLLDGALRQVREPAATPAPAAAANDPTGPEWVQFGPESGTLGIPRSEMPQVRMSDRGAMVNFLKARGISHEITEVDPTTLRPSQAEFSRAKTLKAMGATGDTATALVSADGYVIDGHHRWLAQHVKGEPLRVLRFDAPAQELLQAIHDFPSSTRSDDSAQDARRAAVMEFKDALADLGEFLTRHQRAAMVGEQEPEFKKLLVEVFVKGIKLLGTDMKRLVSWVKQQLKTDPATKKVWNKVTAEEYRQAAEAALAEIQNAPGAQMGLFDDEAAATTAVQGDLFAGAPAAQPAPDGGTAARPSAPAPDKPAPYRAYLLTPQDREKLMALFPPTHERVIADHLSAQALDAMHLVKEGPAKGEVVGVFDHHGMQALVVKLNGREKTASGSYFHLSWSTDAGVRTRNIGPAITEYGFDRLEKPIPLDLSGGPNYRAPARDLSPSAERREGESDKEFAKRVVDKRSTPISLPERHSLYFNIGEAQTIQIADLVSTKTAEENTQGGENGAKRMAAAAAGELSRRGPITVMPSEAQPGKFEVVDGNGTLTSVARYGWKSLPATVVTRAEGARMKALDEIAEAEKDAGKVTRLDGRPYSMTRDNFDRQVVLPRLLVSAVGEATARAAQELADEYYRIKAAPQITAEQRTEAEAKLMPRMLLAAQAKAEFDNKVISIAKETGALGQMLAPLKGIGRAAEKLVVDEHGKVDGIKDLLRATIVVGHYDDAQAVIDAIRREFDVMRIKNRSMHSIIGEKVFVENRAKYAGYSDVMLNVTMPNCTVAEIQINVPAMMAAKSGPGHKLYEVWREQPEDSPLAAKTDGAMRNLYDAAFDAAKARLDAAQLKKASSVMGAPDRGSPPAGSSEAPSSDALNTDPSGNSTNSSPENEAANRQPLGNLSGIGFTGSTSTSPKQDSIIRGDTGGTNDNPVPNNRPRAAGPGAEVQGRTSGEGRTGAVPAGEGQRSDGRDLPVGAGQEDPGAAVSGEGARDERGGRRRARARTQRGDSQPAGRGIAPKSGLNYRFSDDDISPPGSWAKRAEWNVEAVELVKRLETEKRAATAAEQRVLARWVGWGASELAQNLFGQKAEREARLRRQYDALAAKMGDRESLRRPGRYDYTSGGELFWEAVGFLREADPKFIPHQTDEITRKQLQDAAPPKSVLRWAELRDRLKAVMTPAELAEAARSTQYGHYTSAPIVRGMWAALERFGFKGGLVLEPGAGKGNFPGLMPDAMAGNSAYTGIEYDSITGAVLKHLFPDERVLVESFMDSKLPRDFYDVGVGNPPFGNIPVLSDREYRDQRFKLHDYFFAKTIDRVRPGGLLVFVTSRFTMDKQGDAARKYLAERADLVGAIRLSQAAFKDNAGTEVVTDVLFLRKKVPGQEFEHGQAWQDTRDVTIDGEAVPVNEYFVAHPEMILGRQALAGSMYAKNEYTVLPDDTDIAQRFAEAVARMPADIFAPPVDSAAHGARVRDLDFNPKVKKPGNFYLSDAGVLMQREAGQGAPVEGMSKAERAIVVDYVPLRDALKQAQADQLNGGDWEASLTALQAAYKTFVAKHGNLLQSRTQRRRVKVDVLDDEGTPTGEQTWDEEEVRIFPLRSLLATDPDATLVLSLEKVNDETGEVSTTEALTQRVLGGRPAARIATPHDALLASLADTGRVDIPAIGERLDMLDEEVIEALGAAIYRNPEGGEWETADAYLSGNVKDKLAKAQEAARQDKRYERNIEALKAAQPAAKGPGEISIGIGMNWIPGPVYEQFLQETVGVRAAVSFNEATRQWSVSLSNKGASDEFGLYRHGSRIKVFKTRDGAEKAAQGKGGAEFGWTVKPLNAEAFMAARSDWGTEHRPAHQILEHALSGRKIVITRTEGTGENRKTVTLTEEMEAANEKMNRMRQEFSEWVWRDAERSRELVQTYNDKFNTTVPRKFDGSFLTLPGSSTLKEVYPHVKRGAWRIVQTGNTYLAHAVGSGKTWATVISAMEQRRLGIVKKPMFVVPNHMLQQFAAEWMELYPAAKLMVADEANFTGEHRRRFVSRVAMSDLDGVIITHDAFKRLDLDPEFRAKIVQEQVAELMAAAEAAAAEDDSGEGKKSRRVKQIEAQIQRLEERLKARADGAKKDQNARFDELGVDMLYVDEAHVARKLDIATARQVKGISTDGSQLAMNLYMAVRYLNEKRPGRAIVMMSGTPVTNTLGELYTVQKFMNLRGLKDRGIEDFDSWAAMFGRENTALEVNAAGKYEPVTRFTKFVNVPELTQMFREFADVLTADELARMLGDKRPKVEGGARKVIVTPKTPEYADYQKVLEARYQASREWKPRVWGEHNPDPLIAIIGDGRLAAIDMRFMDPSLPSNPQSKLNRLIDDVIAEYKETADLEFSDKKTGKVEPNKGATMMVFSDLGFGEGVARHRGFSARAWFEKRLRDAGVPAAHVAFMEDHKKSYEKIKLFRAMNSGAVRILVGSSKNMGTGVNAQQRLKALFHLDVPWFPADLEQREGRAVRQGNKNKTVRLKAYAAKGSYDQQMWQLVAGKQAFIDAALSGDDTIRELDDLSAVGQAEMAAGMVADDPRVIQLAGLRADIDRLGRLYQAHEQQRARFMQDYTWAEREVSALRAALPAAESFAKEAPDLSGDKFAATVDGQAYTSRKEWAQALKARANALAGAVQPSQTIGEVGGLKVRFESYKTDAAYEWAVGVERRGGMQAVDPLFQSLEADDVGIAMRAVNAATEAARAPERIRDRISQLDAQIDALRPRLEARFPMLDMLAAKRRDVVDLEREIAGPPAASEDEIEQALQGAALGMADEATLAREDGREYVGARVDVQREAKALGLPATGPTDRIARMVRIARADPRTWTRDDFDTIAPHLSVHQDLRDGAADRMPAILAEGLASGMVDSVGSMQDGRAWTWARGLLGKPAYVFISGGLKYQSDSNPRLAPGNKPLFAITPAKGQGFYEALQTAQRAGAWPTVTDSAREAEPTFRGKTLAQDLEAQEAWLQSEAKARGFADVDALLAGNPEAFERLAAKWRARHPVDDNVQAPRRKYTDDRQGDLFNQQLDLFTASRPVETQAGPGVEAARRAAADALGVLRGSGTVLGRALAGGLAARQKASLVGQVVRSAEDLATLAQVYRDPRFETFRVFFTDDKGKVVAQAGLTSRLPGSTPVIVGKSVMDHVQRMAQAAKAAGAKAVWLMHNHPSGNATPSSADEAVTISMGLEYYKAGMQFMGQVVIDTNHYAEMYPGGGYDIRQVDFKAQEPFEGSGVSQAGMQINSPADVMRLAKGLQVEEGAVTLIALSHSHKVHGIATLPAAALPSAPKGAGASALRAWSESAMRVVRRAVLANASSKVVAVGRDKRTLENLQLYGMVLDAVHVTPDGRVESMAEKNGVKISAVLPYSRRVRITGDTSPAFEFLRSQTRPAPVWWNGGDILANEPTTAYDPAVADVQARAEAMIQMSASTPRPIDAAFKLASKVTGLERLASVAYGLGGKLLDRVVPEAVKAGVVSDYGIPQAVVDKRGEFQGALRGQMLKAGTLVEKLATLTRAESRVAYEWMSGEDTRTADELMAALPPESVKVLEEVRALIDTLSEEAVRLGQLDPEARDRHRFAYLRRSYFKHAADLTNAEKAARGRAVAILGEQYKGRGMVRPASMKQIQAVAPEWWGRKLKDGKADTALKGEQFIRFERRAPAGEGVGALEGMEDQRRPGKLLEVNFWPAGEKPPAKYADWENAGKWEVVDTKGGDALMWRDFTKAERERMGEIDEARYAIARTLRGMIQDVEVGRYLEWLARTEAKMPGQEIEGTIIDAKELGWGSGMRPLPPGTWVKVPDTKVPGTNVARYGALAGRYLPGPIWNDVRQVNQRFMPLGEGYQSILRAWKIAKTALSPVVHVNNIMANFVMADWHDVTAGDVAKSLQILLAAVDGQGKGAIGAVGNLAGKTLGAADVAAAKEVIARYEASGGSIGGWVNQEIAQGTMDSVRDLLRAEVNGAMAEAGRGQIGVMAAVQALLQGKMPQAYEALRASRPVEAVITEGSTMIDLYQAEDDIFRLAAWLKVKQAGGTDAEAGRAARRSFLDYSINAPWIAAMRATAWPFISFTYRAVPMMLEAAGKKPHKLVKLVALAGALNALGAFLAGSSDEDEDRLRRMLPDEKSGRIWGMVPKLIRMPWNDAHGSAVYLDIRRWIPVGDVLDVGQTPSAVPVPPATLPGGPLIVLGEIVFNKSAFTKQEISNRDIDTVWEQVEKAGAHLWKAFAPNIVGLPGTYATEGVLGAAKGRTDVFGRQQSVPQAVASSFGLKVSSYPADVLERNVAARTQFLMSELDREAQAVKRQFVTNRISEEEMQQEIAKIVTKKEKLAAAAREKLR